MTAVAKYPDSTKTSLEQRLRARARERWPQIASLQIRHRGNFSYIDATLTDATTFKLCRLRYVGSASQWQFAIYRASHDDYDESVFFTGLPAGTCQDALDTACGLYLNDPTAWTRPPTNLRARPLSVCHAASGTSAWRSAPGTSTSLARTGHPPSRQAMTETTRTPAADVGAVGGGEVLDAVRILAGHRLSSARWAGGTPARHCVPAARCSLFCRRWNWSATSAVTRAQEVPSRIPAVASESQWAAR